MRSYTITTPLWLLLGLPIVLAIDQVSSQNDVEITYQELNIYPYQGIYLECKDKNPLKPVLPTPLDKGEYYVENPLEESPSSLKVSRKTKKLEDDFPELKFFPNGKKYTLYYTAPGKHKSIQRIYFECIGAVPDVTAIIQLNIMPEGKYLPKEEHLVLDELPLPKGKKLVYTKELTPGVKIVTECKNSELVLNDGIGVSVKKPEAKAYTNPVTMVEYQDITEYVTKHTATKNMHIIDLRDGRFSEDTTLEMYCKNKPENKLVYISSHMDDIPGLHAYYRLDDVVELDDSTKIVQVKTEDETQVLVDVPIKTGAIFPKDCLNNVFTATGEMVKMSKIVRNAKLTRMTDSLKILDLSHASSYREITVSCFVNRPQRGVWSKGAWMNVTISPSCNFHDKKSLDSDGKTCTLFASSYAESLVATPMELTQSSAAFELEEAFFMRSDDPRRGCKDCHYQKIGEQDDGISVSITKGMDNQKIMIIDGVIRYNPVYILSKKEVKGGKAFNPTRIIRMYLHNYETSIGVSGRVTVAKDHKVNNDGGSVFYRIQIGGHKRIAISCKDFFEDHASLKPTLLPSGKNTIFENVSDGAVDPRMIKTAEFEKLFQSKGITILKKPAPGVDLEIKVSTEKVIKSDHYRPIYFICSPNVKGKWDSKNPYAIIAIDPGYMYDGQQDLPEEEDPPIVIDDPPDQPEEEVALVEPKQVPDTETAKIDGYGKVTVEDKFKVKKAGGKSILYRVQPGDKRDIKISCKDIFEDSGSSGYTLFPNGKNTIFENVSDGSVDPRTIKTIQFEQDFASMGISILKKPETEVDMRLIFDEDKLIQNEYIKPIYFICAQNVQGEWQDNEKPYAIIAIDPGYEIRKLQGCGVKSGMFLGQGESSITGNQCMHTVDDETRIGFHCPSYVPEHFLEGDQSKHKAAEDAEIGNPYQLLLRCYDRSSVSQRMFRPKTDLGLFSRPKFAGELRSLWVFDRNTFAEKKHLTDIHCTCYDKTGKAISSIQIKNNTNKNE